MYVVDACGDLPKRTFRPLDTYAYPWVQHIGVHGAVLYDDSSGGAVGGIQGVDVVVALDVAFACGGLSGGFIGGGWGGMNEFLFSVHMSMRYFYQIIHIL